MVSNRGIKIEAGQVCPGFGIQDNNRKPINPFVNQSKSDRHVDGGLIVPPPDQVSKDTNIPCVTVFKISKPDPLRWRTADSYVYLTIDDPDEKISWDIVKDQQPIQRKFRVHTDTITEDLEHMYFLVDNVRFPAVGTYKLQFRVFVRTQYLLSHNTDTGEDVQTEFPLPPDVWRMGQPKRPSQAGFYVACIFELKQHVQVKEDKDVKRTNPLSKSQLAFKAALLLRNFLR